MDVPDRGSPETTTIIVYSFDIFSSALGVYGGFILKMMEEQEKANPDDATGSIEPVSAAGRTESAEIPPEGSLGLLALGAVGLVEWRHARDRAKREAEEAAKAEQTASDGSATDGEAPDNNE